MSIAGVGALCFGLVVGWITYRTLIRRSDRAALSDISTVIAAVGGAAVTGLFKDKTLFGWYSIGLAAGFVVYFALFWIINGKDEVGEVMGGKKPSPGRDL
ncbi:MULTISPECIES: hypothetical protein [unclassified Kribbella]|uniref:hypothetical protein n=1 Tax=unclassified Kribbella TaxID=2644121 RepID=UPI0030191F48